MKLLETLVWIIRSEVVWRRMQWHVWQRDRHQAHLDDLTPYARQWLEEN